MQITVKLYSGQELAFVVNQSPFVIGRSPKCDVVVPEEGVSRHHCQIEVEESEIWITDLGSTNGVMIDGIKIEPNKKTKWLTYLTLSFGPVQSLQVSFDETHSGMKSAPKAGQPIVVTAQNLTKTQSYKSPDQGSGSHKLELEQKPQPKSKTKKQVSFKNDDADKKKKLLILGVLILIVLGLAYHFTKEETEIESVEVLEPIQ